MSQTATGSRSSTIGADNFQKNPEKVECETRRLHRPFILSLMQMSQPDTCMRHCAAMPHDFICMYDQELELLPNGVHGESSHSHDANAGLFACVGN